MTDRLCYTDPYSTQPDLAQGGGLDAPADAVLAEARAALSA